MTVLSLTLESPYLGKTVFILRWGPGPHLNIKTVFSRYRNFHYEYKMVVRLSYIYNGNSYTGKMTSLYWASTQVMSYLKILNLQCISCAALMHIYGIKANLNSRNCGISEITPPLSKLSQKLWHFHKNIRPCVENECWCPCTVNILNGNFT